MQGFSKPWIPLRFIQATELFLADDYKDVIGRIESGTEIETR
jgi:hypothetical protein